jgi:hypothetical protein
MPVDHRALGFESEEALLDALRVRFRIPYDWVISVHPDVIDGQPVLTMLIWNRDRAQKVFKHERH